jgi:hypothetical protein
VTKICSLSAILICRFHLDLIRRNTHSNTHTSLGLSAVSVGSFHAATQRVHDAVMAEFGDLNTDVLVDAEILEGEVIPADPGMPSTSDNEITMVEVLSQPQVVEITVEA